MDDVKPCRYCKNYPEIESSSVVCWFCGYREDGETAEEAVEKWNKEAEKPVGMWVENKCSRCGFVSIMENAHDFYDRCPVCGAKLKEG